MLSNILTTLAVFATTALASGSTECTRTTYVTSTTSYPGATTTTLVDGVYTTHSTVWVTVTPTLTPAPAATQAQGARGSPCSSYTTTTSTRLEDNPDPSWTWTITEWATTVTGAPTTVSTCAIYTTPDACGFIKSTGKASHAHSIDACNPAAPSLSPPSVVLGEALELVLERVVEVPEVVAPPLVVVVPPLAVVVPLAVVLPPPSVVVVSGTVLVTLTNVEPSLGILDDVSEAGGESVTGVEEVVVAVVQA
ncbi:hypothetical protein EV715DRAFT_263353 [Schizophyllum commune]